MTAESETAVEPQPHVPTGGVSPRPPSGQPPQQKKGQAAGDAVDRPRRAAGGTDGRRVRPAATLGGLTRDTAALRHARPAFVVAQAVSLACYALLYRRVLYWCQVLVAHTGAFIAAASAKPGHYGRRGRRLVS